MMNKFFASAVCLGLGVTASAAVVLKADFEKNSGSMHVPSHSKDASCSVIAVPDAHGGKKVMQFKAGTNSSVLDSGTMLSQQCLAPRVKLSFFARGKGRIRAELLTGYRTLAGKDKNSTASAPQEVKLTDVWQKVEFLHDFADMAPFGVYVRIRLAAGGEAQVDDILLETCPVPEVKVKAYGRGTILKAKEELPVCRFSVTPEKTALQGFVVYPDRSFGVKKVAGGKLPDAGKAFVPGLYRIGAASGGNSAEVFVSALEEKQYDEFDQAAKLIRLESPVRILVLGDSLYDYSRGRNAVDKLCWWLEKYNPGKVQCRNAAVGGDYITRIEERLKGEKKQHRQQMYDNLFDKPYQLIFLAVGANDNRTLRSKKYQEPLVPFAEQQAAMERVLKFLTEKNPRARIILIGSTSAHEALQARREKSSAEYVKFCVPELTRQGIAAQKKAAAACGAEYIDFFDEMHEIATPDFFARNDTVHLDEKGFNFIAEKLLQYLATHPEGAL